MMYKIHNIFRNVIKFDTLKCFKYKKEYFLCFDNNNLTHVKTYFKSPLKQYYKVEVS